MFLANQKQKLYCASPSITNRVKITSQHTATNDEKKPKRKANAIIKLAIQYKQM